MYICFGEFRYEIKKQLLYRQEELLPLKRNQATLLDFFIKDAHSIHNKNDILDVIWANQDVSQQVVFQTISELRSILGNEAIKTFSKKGYRWNLSLEIDEHNSPVDTIKLKPLFIHHNALAESPNKQLNTAKKNKSIIVFLSIFFMITLGIFLFQAENDKPISFHFLTVKKETSIGEPTIDAFQKAVSELNEVTTSRLPSKLYPSQAFASPSLVFKRSGISPDEWLFWSESFSSNTGAFLHYGLSRDQIHWQGYVYAESLEKLPSSLAQRLKELSSLGLFSRSIQALDDQAIKTMLTIAPDDSDLLLLIAKNYETVGQYDIALSYLEKLTKLKPTNLSKVYIAQALWKSAVIYQTRGQHLQVHHNLDAMKVSLSGSPVWPLYFQYVETLSWLTYNERQYQEMRLILADASQKISFSKRSHEQIDPLLLFKFHILYSILSKKTSDEAGKYHHLNQAQALLIKHNLDESNLAVVFYHFALFAQQEENNSVKISKQNSDISQSASLIYLTKILELPRTSDNYWVHDAAFELLVNQYIAQSHFKIAESLFPDRNLSTKQLYLKAELFRVQNKLKQARELFELVFDRARLEFDIRTGVDAALWLYVFSNKDSKEKSEYRAYMESNANKDWLQKKLKTI
jgi:DNA-binding winged helix-turn-helix (wHTH) protein